MSKPPWVNRDFAIHDEQLRTYTTMLAMLGAKLAVDTVRERPPPLKGGMVDTAATVQRRMAHAATRETHFDRDTDSIIKVLSGIACILVRSHEVVCVMPKRLLANGLLKLQLPFDSPAVKEVRPWWQLLDVAPRPTIHITRNPSQEESVLFPLESEFY